MSECSLMCSDETWAAWTDLVDLITGTPVVYGPGRGLFADGEWVVTWGPGRLGRKDWKGKGKRGPSFHCSSWTNFAMGLLTGRNEQYTHSGNVPSLFDVLENNGEMHGQIGVASYRGYGDNTSPLLGGKVASLLDIYRDRKELPTFLVVGVSTRKDKRWKWWHHTTMLVVDHRQDDSPLYRIAADGYKTRAGVYSCTPMRYTEITEAKARGDVGRHRYKGSVLHPEGVPAPVRLEA